MKNIPLRIGKLFLVVLPLILGMIGLWGMAGEPLLDALFSCVSMYVLNYGDPPVNLFVELARWLAPITTVSGIMLALRAIRDQARCLLRCWLGDCVVVYGPEEPAERLTERLGRRAPVGATGSCRPANTSFWGTMEHLLTCVARLSAPTPTPTYSCNAPTYSLSRSPRPGYTCLAQRRLAPGCSGKSTPSIPSPPPTDTG